MEMSQLHTERNRPTDWGGMLLGWGALARLPLIWRARLAERRHMRQLDERLLKDIGLDADLIERETNKPFWQA